MKTTSKRDRFEKPAPTQADYESAPATSVRIREPYSILREFKVRRSDEGLALDACLAERFPFHSIDEWRKKIKRGDVLLNGQMIEPAYEIHPFQSVQHQSYGVVEPAVPDQVPIIQETEGWLIVHKPAPLPVHSGGRYHHNTLLEILRDRGWDDLRPVHRLDAVTSGLICLAKGARMAERLSKAFQEESKKGYLAVVARKALSGASGAEERVAQVAAKAAANATPEETVQAAAQEFLVNLPIRRKKGFVFEAASDPSDSSSGFKPARTLIQLVASQEGPASFEETQNQTVPPTLHIAQCIPITGRTHQIRLHLRAAGLPIVDDPIYGPAGDDSGETLQNRSIALQSSYLSVPSLGLHAELPVPEEWLTLFGQDVRYDRTIAWNSPGLSRNA